LDVGKRTGDRLQIRHSHSNADSETANGTCSTVIARDGEGRLTLSEAWEWESKPGRGMLREVER